MPDSVLDVHSLTITTIEGGLYCEVKILCAGYFEQIAIGVKRSDTVCQLPGYGLHSCGWHGDDGKLWVNGQVQQ